MKIRPKRRMVRSKVAVAMRIKQKRRIERSKEAVAKNIARKRRIGRSKEAVAMKRRKGRSKEVVAMKAVKVKNLAQFASSRKTRNLSPHHPTQRSLVFTLDKRSHLSTFTPSSCPMRRR